MFRAKLLMTLGLAAAWLPLADTAKAAGPYDGVYAGTQRETKSNNTGWCQHINRNDIRLMVMDSTIRYRWGNIPLQATVASHGSFSVSATGASSGSASFTGRISIGNLEADVGTAACAAHVSLKKL